MKCKFCGRDVQVPCMNSRDVEDFAASDDVCLSVLERDRTLGERGYDRVVNNKVGRV